MGEIQIGYQVGRLTLEEPTGRRKSGYMVWRCRCGCLSRPPLKEFRGKRFGKLTVVEYAGKENGMHRWKCVCDCGRISKSLVQADFAPSASDRVLTLSTCSYEFQDARFVLLGVLRISNSR